MTIEQLAKATRLVFEQHYERPNWSALLHQFPPELLSGGHCGVLSYILLG